MNTQIVNPNLSNFIKSLRDVGYTFEIAVADILDNSITAGASVVKIYTVAEPEPIFVILDNGTGMSDEQLVEAMRLSTRDPEESRDKNDLGRFGLGLKTASFSQATKLTVVSKKADEISAKRWDLDLISKKNEWLLISPEISSISDLPLFDELKKQKNGTLVVWQNIDRYRKDSFAVEIGKLRDHLELVFHRFLEGAVGIKSFKIFVNNSQLKAFNPFNILHPATQQASPEKIKLFHSTIIVQPFILPHHSKLSQQEYERYATEEGYTKSQGFYLYRSNRLLIYGTWWGLHRTIDAHKLVRVKIDISNDQDRLWGIDIKKSTARPLPEIKNDLIRIIEQATEKGSRPYTGRGRKINDTTTIRFWQLVALNENFRFALNREHPLLKKLIAECGNTDVLNAYLNGLEAYLPLEAIQAQLQQSPHKLEQEAALTDEEIGGLVRQIRSAGVDPDFLESLLKTELFKNRKELFNDDLK